MTKYKVIVFVPEENLEDVRAAMADAGAGVIGDYTYCSFATQGIGTFLGGDNTDPAFGEKGKLEEVPEWRLEMIVTENKLQAVVAAMKSVHPYEEVAYDVFAIIDI